ncbi:MAG: type II toxin-antitoxin system RelE/ParE family toxin [Sedimenticola sp.]
MYQLVYKKAALKGILKMPTVTKKKMLEAFSTLSENPDRQDLDMKQLKVRDGYRLRVGQWRAIFHRDDDKLILLVVDAGPRGDIYK